MQNNYRILITGGAGLIGRTLTKLLLEEGHEVSILSRSKKSNVKPQHFHWNIEERKIDPDAFKGVDYVIHLAGANIGEKRWTAGRRKQIYNSRIEPGKLLFDHIKENKISIKAFISASAVGYYGSLTSDIIFSEENEAAEDFLGDVCKKWEEVADEFRLMGIRVVKIRTGVVLTANSGALQKMIKPIKMGIGSALGSGKQYIPWIHIDDLCKIFLKAINDSDMDGAYNAVSPSHVTNEEFGKTIASVLNKPFWFPKVPALLIKLVFGQMADIVLKGSRVSSKKIQDSGFVFKYPELKSALINLLIKK